LEEARERLAKFVAHRKLKRAAIRVIAQMVMDENEEARVRALIAQADKDVRGRVNLGQVVCSTGVGSGAAFCLPD
jgi:hypothetical protein